MTRPHGTSGNSDADGQGARLLVCRDSDHGIEIPRGVLPEDEGRRVAFCRAQREASDASGPGAAMAIWKGSAREYPEGFVPEDFLGFRLVLSAFQRQAPVISSQGR